MERLYDVIIGWDFGHGENAADALRLDEIRKSAEPLNLGSDNAREAVTVILYRDAQVFVGKEAKDDLEAIPYFKERPQKWDDTLAGRTKGSMMFDYFHETMKKIRIHNPSYFKGEEKILLLVGCPSSESWLKPPKHLKEYETLIRRATGVDDVMVIPESRAALFSMLSPSDNRAISVAGGAIVFDFGSSTLDFTYMKLGEYHLDRSCTLGASYLEHMMFLRILADNGINPGDIWEKETGSLELWLREFKEYYYATGNTTTRILAPSMLDENGDPIVEGKNRRGDPTCKKRQLVFTLDDDFMDRVTESFTFFIEENGISLGKKSWKEHMRAFLTSVKNELDQKELPYNTILLTGGASRMPFVPEICREVFGIDILCESNPSHSVSRGLCMIGNVDIQLPDLIAEGIRDVQRKTDACFDTLIDTCAGRLAQISYDASKEVFQSVANQQNDLTVGELNNRLTTAMNDAFSEGTVSGIMKEECEHWSVESREIIVDVANRATVTMYPDHIGNDLLLPPHYDLTSLNTDFSISGDFLTGKLNFESFLGKIISTTLAIAAAAFLLSIPGIGILLSPFAYILVKVIAEVIAGNENRNINQRTRTKIKNEYINKEDERKKELKDRLSTELRGAFAEHIGKDNAVLHEITGSATQEAFDIVALRRFRFSQ